MQRDNYQPVWDLGMSFPNVPPGDKRLIQIKVFDMDETGNDPIGDYQFVLGEVVKKGPIQEIPLFSEKGELFAGGLLAIKILVEEF